MESETERKGIFTRLLDEELQRAPLTAWKEQLGIDKKASVPKQRQYIWSLIFVELVDLLRPYCSGPKRLHLSTIPGAIPDQVFVVASHLMHLTQPTLWPDRPDLVKSSYDNR